MKTREDKRGQKKEMRQQEGTTRKKSKEKREKT